MLVSSCTVQNNQLILPDEVQRALGVAQGDLVAFEIINHQVILRKANAAAQYDLNLMGAALADEWLSTADEEAYCDL
jgi:bifunctional DNA-binding transcriptional regulator/antitoxin component of YhaV-PrlF toxin-antitoxin module